MVKKKDKQKETESQEKAQAKDGSIEGDNVVEGEILVEDEMQTEDETAVLAIELEAALAKAEENLDGWMRAQAEFANYRKRMERDRIQLRDDQTAEVIFKYLEVVDDLALALKNRPAEGEDADWGNGIELIYRKLMTILENEGVTPMEAEGETFDPNLHEAISQEESSDHESGQIIEVLKEGYLIGGRVLRPSLVRIAI